MIARFKIATKLWLFISLVVLSIVAVGWVGIWRSEQIFSDGQAQQNNAAQLVQLSTEWTGLTQANTVRDQAMILAPGVTGEEAFKEGVAQSSQRISAILEKMAALNLTDADQTQLQKVKEYRAQVINGIKAARKLKAEGQEEEALRVTKADFLPAVAKYLEGQREFVAMQNERVKLVANDLQARRLANGVFMGSSIIAIMVAIGFATGWFVRSIRQPLDQANGLAARIAQGDLSSELTTTREDEFGQLLHSLGSMNASLSTMVSQVRSSTDNIAIASSEIATGNNDLAQRTEQTSSNLQATASSMDSITATVQNSTDSAKQASALAANASMVAQRGGQVVGDVVATMQEIDASSKKISDIISVIDGIAFQTNILALNAAVEAARAGEQGRGFAVVASEVRSLAGRSAEAAKEIKALIGVSVDKVESGTRLVTEAGATMSDIVESVTRVADVIREITETSAAQNAGISDVNAAITNLDQMTQQNAALVEQSAAAAESLREQAQNLKLAVSVFKVAGENSLAVAGRTARGHTARLPFTG